MYGSVVIFGKAKVEISVVPFQNGSLTYTGAVQSPAWSGYDSSPLEIGGVTSATNAGTYTATFTPKEGYVWSDGSADAKSVTWTIKRASLTVPTLKTSLTYTGSEQTAAWNNYDSSKMTIGGTTKGTNAGSYTATFTPKANYQWSDGSTAAKSVTWTIGRASLAVPTAKGGQTYTGSEQAAQWNGYDSSKMTIGGTTKGTNVGSYNATFTPTGNYKWSDGTTAVKTVTWTIGKASLTVPTQKTTLTYSGSAQSPTWNNYDSGKMTLGGTTTGTNAGSYTATFTPKANYQWSDGSTAAKSVTWTIGNAAGSLSLNKTSMSLNVSTLTGTIGVTRAGDGAITASSSDTSVATVSVSGTTVTVTAKAKGSATITVSVAAGTNHTAPAQKTCSVTSDLPSRALADNTPATIQAVAKAGVAPNYWSVGDKIGIKVNGSFGDLSYNDTVYAFIIGFNHNSSIEGNNSIHFQFGKDSSGKNFAFCDSKLYINGSGPGSDPAFRMNTTKTNTGGWASSYMRNTICPAFLAALPAAWQEVIAPCTKYTDNVGGGNGDVAANITATVDWIFLLSEQEVFGTTTSSNAHEADYQEQYEYYANGNSKVMYNETGTACAWWTRSVSVKNTDSFRDVTSGGSSGGSDANYSFSFAPGLKVA